MWVKSTKDTPITHVLVKGQSHAEIMDVHNSLSHGDIHPNVNFSMPMSKSKDDLAQGDS